VPNLRQHRAEWDLSAANSEPAWQQNEPGLRAIHWFSHIHACSDRPKLGKKVYADWSFNVDDENARLTLPPKEVRLPVQEAAHRLRAAMNACRRAALDLGVAVPRTRG
jgi:hypothetical protein